MAYGLFVIFVLLISTYGSPVQKNHERGKDLYFSDIKVCFWSLSLICFTVILMDAFLTIEVNLHVILFTWTCSCFTLYINGYSRIQFYDKADSRKGRHTTWIYSLAQALSFYTTRSWNSLFTSARLGKNTTRRSRWTQTSEQNCFKFPLILEWIAVTPYMISNK